MSCLKVIVHKGKVDTTYELEEKAKAEVPAPVKTKACSGSGQKVVAFLSFLLNICLTTIASFAAMPLLLLSLVVTRLFQLFRRGHDYEKVTHLKIFITTCVHMDVTLLLPRYIILGSIAYFVPSIRHATLLDMPIFEWFLITNWIFVGGAWTHFIGTLLTKNVLSKLIPLDNNESGLNVVEALSEIVCSIVLWVMGSSIRRIIESTFLETEILGLQIWKWIKALIILLICFDTIRITTHLMVYWLEQRCKNLGPESDFYVVLDKLLYRKYLTYCASGLRRNISFVMTSILFLLTWIFFFGPRLNDTHKANVTTDFGTRTCVSLLICSFFWVVKKCLLLSWEVYDIYNHRLGPKIIETRKHLYFLGILGRCKNDIFKLRYEFEAQKTSQKDTGNDHQKEARKSKKDRLFEIYGSILRWWVRLVLDMTSVGYNYASKDDKEDECGKKQENAYDDQQATAAVTYWKLSNKKWKKVNGDLFMQKEDLRSKGWSPTLYDMQRVAQYLLTTKDALSNEEYVSQVINDMKSNNQLGHDSIEVNDLKKFINSNQESTDGDTFIAMLQPSGYVAVSYEELEIWMEEAQNKCLFLANTLSSSEEVVKCLDKIISLIVIVASFIMWLLLTGLATTAVFVIIASPLLAATFIFGETCKTFFQGIIFVYVLHPFRVGDTCVIEPDNDEKLVVKALGVWKTIFVERNTRAEVIYPNSELAKKKIVNHKFIDFKWLGKTKQTKKDEKQNSDDNGEGGQNGKKRATAQLAERQSDQNEEETETEESPTLEHDIQPTEDNRDDSSTLPYKEQSN